MRKDTGQSAVELAILLPLLMLILVGCLDVGRAFLVWMALANGSREGARYACTHPTDDRLVIEEQIRGDILAEGLSAGALGFDIRIPQETGGGAPVKVTAVYSMPMMTSFLFGGRPLVIRAATQMMIVEGQ